MKTPLSPSEFHWAGGIENTFIPQERPGPRALEEYELTQHYAQWRADLTRAASLAPSRDNALTLRAMLRRWYHKARLVLHRQRRS